MINISYNYISNGPGKVVSNLMKGLDKSGINYKTNQIPEPDDDLLILQETQFLHHETNGYKIIGPNICVLPIDNGFVMNQNYKKMIVPSEWVKQLYMKWLPEEKLFVWAVGIDTDLFYDMSKNQKDIDCLIYFKRRDESELNKIISFLEDNNQTFTVVRYGGYGEYEFIQLLERSKYCIVIDKPESQGVAIQEIMSTNTPLLVWDPTEWGDRGESYKVSATSVPYWDDRCGIKFTNYDDLKNIFTYFINNKDKFSPRDFITENLSLEISAQKILSEFKN
jgi:hypothetical protein